MKNTVKDRLLIVEVLLGLRDDKSPELAKLRLSQAAHAFTLLSIAHNTPETKRNKKKVVNSYVKDSAIVKALK